MDSIPDDVVGHIADALGGRDAAMIEQLERLVGRLTAEGALALLTRTDEAERSSALAVAEGSPRRSRATIYLALAREYLSPEDQALILGPTTDIALSRPESEIRLVKLPRRTAAIPAAAATQPSPANPSPAPVERAMSVDGARAEIERILNRLSARDRARVIERVLRRDEPAAPAPTPAAAAPAPARVESAIAGAIQTALEVFAREIVARVRNPGLADEPPPAARPAKAPAPSAKPRARTTNASSAAKGTAPKEPKAPKATTAPEREGGDIRSAFLAFVAAHPGNRLEDIAKALDESTLSVKPIAALLRDRALVRCVGRTRAMRYYPA